MLKKTLIKTIWMGGLALGLAGMVQADEIQGVVVDWNCAKPMVKDGREATLRNNHNCSLMKKYDRGAYGLITNDKKYFRLDDSGNAKIKQLLKDTPDKDDLKVVVDGEIQGDTLKVVTISEL